MFTVTDSQLDRNCQGFRRRDFLRVGSLALGGVGLSQLLQAQAAAAPAMRSVRDKSVVLLFLQGGPSHIEFFDPKMSAPIEIRSVTGEVQTRTAGVTFGGTFPQLASRTDRFAIVRSYGSQNAGHTYLDVVSAQNPLKASVSSLYARVAGTNHPVNGMPRNVLVLPEAVQDGLKLGSNFETGALPTLTDPGRLGDAYRAFEPGGGGQLKKNLELQLSEDRFLDRRHLLRQLDDWRRRAEQSSGLAALNDPFQAQAFEVLARGIGQAFDLSREEPATLARYDTRGLFRAADIQKWNDMRRSSNLLGLQMLMARRLCEAGCGFVTVSDCGWDMHANGNSPKHMAGLDPLGRQVDHAVSAFLDDLRERGLEDKILLVVTGEMGRTPRLNGGGGRDHYGTLTPLLVAGGGLRMDQVIGQSDQQAARPTSTPYAPADLLATILHTVFDIGALRLATDIPREITQFIERNEPIAGLLG